ncbi:MAG: hypothetical protein HQK67_00525 [Desulfamplus sp.]|nr:hypothetical protein [Desulfamplus sp.]
MFKTITTIIVTIIVVLFSIENFDHVPVSFVVGKPMDIRLIFVISIAGVVGYLIRHFSAIATEDRLKRQLQHFLKRKNAGKNIVKKNGNNKKSILVDDFDEEDDF